MKIINADLFIFTASFGHIYHGYQQFWPRVYAHDRKLHKPVVTNLNLSSSSPTSSSSTFRPGKKNPIILLKNWYMSWMVSGTTFTYK